MLSAVKLCHETDTDAKGSRPDPLAVWEGPRLPAPSVSIRAHGPMNRLDEKGVSLVYFITKMSALGSGPP